MPEVRAATNNAGSRDADRGSILLFGMPRSGTTWLGKLFDSHPDTLYRHEPDTWRRFDPSVVPRYPCLADSARYAQTLSGFLRSLPCVNALRVAGKQPTFPKSYLSRPRYRLMDTSIGIARVASRVYPQFPVLLHHSGDGYPQRRVVWKSIESLGRLGVILAALNTAYAIQILRHPCGYVASIMRGLSADAFCSRSSASEDWGVFAHAINTPLGKRYGLSEAYLAGLTAEERLAWRWVLTNEKALGECCDSDRWMAVRYEDVCADPTGGVARMFDFAGLAMNDQTRAFIGASTSESRDGYYSVFKEPDHAAWRWRQELDPDVIERVNAILRASRMGAYYSDNEHAHSGYGQRSHDCAGLA